MHVQDDYMDTSFDKNFNLLRLAKIRSTIIGSNKTE